MIQTKSIGPAWVVGVTDKNYRLIARSRDQERFVGQRATDDFIANTQGVEGGFLGKTLDGVPVLNAYVRSSLSGWRIVAGVPLATLEAPLRRSYLLLASMAAAGLLPRSVWPCIFALPDRSGRRAAGTRRQRGRGQAGGSVRHRHQGARRGVARARPSV